MSFPPYPDGLPDEAVAERVQAGQTNRVPRTTSRPVSQILRSNIFTPFNAILTTAMVVVLAMGDWRDSVFALVMVINAAIGVFSELRSKRVLDSVAVLAAPTSQVLRAEKVQTVNNDDLVVDDLVELRLGDQIPADGTVLSTRGLEVDESILTGESLPVKKQVDDQLLSGTAVVAGSGRMWVRQVGADSWAQKITAEARKYSVVTSEIQRAIDRVLKWIMVVLPVVVVLLVWSQTRADAGNWRGAVILAIAGVVGMIPQGLVLLTSMNFGLAAATLSRRGVLVQELPAVEILARVDELCLDKTGTLTTGGIRGQELTVLPGAASEADLAGALGRLTSDETNASATAVQELLRSQAWSATDLPTELTEVPFNSTRKWSALSGANGSWVFGAPEILLANARGDAAEAARQLVAESSSRGQRTLCLSRAGGPIAENQPLPEDLSPQLIAVLSEDIRPDAAETLEYFRSQGVRVRVISGDAPGTVGAIADRLDLGGDGRTLQVVDARTLPEFDTPEFDRATAEVDVFGRVTPEQKRALVRSLQRGGHTVAMTGDGVNDALALKEADLGIAMGNGAPATKAVSRLVLMKSEFSVLPGVVAEGRRIIANMERVSSLFLSKTTYAVMLAVIVSVCGWVYPFLPRQLTFIGALTIGTPAFFLALAPSHRRYHPGFLRRTLWLAVPSGLLMGTGALIVYLLLGEHTEIGQTGATLTLILGALWLLGITARPFNLWRLVLICVMAAGALLGVLIPWTREFFALQWPDPQQWALIGGVGLAISALMEVCYRYTTRFRHEGS